MEPPSQPCPRSLADGLWRSALRLAFPLVLALRRCYRARHRGALVALWWDGRVLLVRNSYRRPWSLPGGSVRRGEPVAAAAARELREEVGLALAPEALEPERDLHLYAENQQDHCTVLRRDLAAAPSLVADCREVVAWAWLEPAAARALELTPVARAYLRDTTPSRPGGCRHRG